MIKLCLEQELKSNFIDSTNSGQIPLVNTHVSISRRETKPQQPNWTSPSSTSTVIPPSGHVVCLHKDSNSKQLSSWE